MQIQSHHQDKRNEQDNDIQGGLQITQEFLGLSFANDKRSYFLHNYSQILTPIRQYYKSIGIAYLLSPQAKYSQNQSCELLKGRNASISKQLQYLRGSLKEPYDSNIVESLILQARNSTDILKRRKNCSTILKQTLYYACKKQLRKLQFVLENGDCQRDRVRLKLLNQQFILVARFEQQILEVLTVSRLKGLLGIRSAYSFTLINVFQKKMVFERSFSGEIITCDVYEDQIDVGIVRSDGITQIITIFIAKEIQPQVLSHFSEQVQSLSIVDHWRLTGNQIFLCMDFQFSIFDLRAKKNEKLAILQQGIQKERNYGSILLKGQNTTNPYFCVSSTFNIRIFDIRKMSHPVLSSQHMCQQAPPNCLQYFDGNFIQNYDVANLDNLEEMFGPSNCLNQPIIIAHSPYKFGSSLFSPFNLERIPQHKKLMNQIFFNRIESCNSVQMLYDTGKVIKQVAPRSVSPYQDKQNSIVFFHIDDHGGVSIQNFVFQTQNSKYYQNKIKIESHAQSFNIASFKQQDLQYQKFCQQQVQRYFEKQQATNPEIKVTENQNPIQEEQEEMVIEQQNVTYFNMRNFLERINLSVIEDKQKQIKPTMSQQPFQRINQESEPVPQENYDDSRNQNDNEMSQEKKSENSQHYSRYEIRKFIRGNFSQQKQSLNYFNPNNVLQQW